MAHIKDFNLITENDLRKLEAFGIRTCAQLVERASTSTDRMNIADRININDSDLKNLAHHSDMMRVKGMTPPLAIALCNAGVCTVPKLAYQNAPSLHQRLNLADPDAIDRRLLEQLIASAKTLPKMIRH
jgi:predicted RecB family nuclease